VQPAEIEPQALFEYLYFHVVPTPATVFRGVYRLRGAQAVVATADAVRTLMYWRPQFAPDCAPRLADLEREFLDIVRAGVVREAEGRKAACFLSGGTDSSTVTGMLAQAIGAAPDAYSIGFDAQGYDEMGYARIAALRFGARHHEYYVTPSDLVQGIPLVARHYDQPFGNSSALPAYFCARQAVGDGFDWMLAGDGGDELFGGNSRYAKQRVFAAYHALPEALRHGVVEPLVLGMDLWSHVPLLKKGVSYVRQAHLPMPERMETYNLLERLGMQKALTPRFLESVDAARPRQQQREVYGESQADLINAMLAYDWKYTLVDNDLPKVCGTADLAGVGVGFPMLTDELTDFSLRLPPTLKVRGLTLRYFFKRALRDFLPEEILRKKKHGFGLPFGPWLLTDSALHGLAADSLAGIVERGLVRREFVDELLGARVHEVPGYYGGMVWVLMMLEQWLRQRAPSYRVT
jgi:asparagine synthase (glutamine-hydrolysing)